MIFIPYRIIIRDVYIRMNDGRTPGKLKNLRAYMPQALRFYSLKSEGITRGIFLVILFTSFLSALIQFNTIVTAVMSFVSITIIYLATAVYLAAYLKDLRGGEYTAGTCFGVISSNVLKIVAASINYLVTVFVILGFSLAPDAAALLLVALTIPITVVYIMFFFAPCFIIDKGYGVIDAYKSSRKLTTGKKFAIFLKIIGFNMITSIPAFFLWMMAAPSNNLLVINFVISFTVAVMNLMQQRLVALMYIDLLGEEEAY